MVKQILFLTSTVLLLVPILLSQEVMAQSRKIDSVKTEPAFVHPSKKVESGSSILGIHEVNLKSIRSQPLFAPLSKRIGAEKAPDVKLAPVHKGSGIVSPAEEDEGLQVQFTSVD
jgi:hypothetical protein